LRRRETSGPTSDEDELVWRVDRADELGAASVLRSEEGAPQEAFVDAGAVEIGQAQFAGLYFALFVRCKKDVLLFFAHAAFKGVGIARVLFSDRVGLRPAIWIDGADEQHPPDAG